ncbi:hypothetical protein PM082_000091 [Marasmius tenuissimus]|nr:hypothetical protein PM082_000091 [Marasmius tenuissimus]
MSGQFEALNCLVLNQSSQETCDVHASPNAKKLRPETILVSSAKSDGEFMLSKIKVPCKKQSIFRYGNLGLITLLQLKQQGKKVNKDVADSSQCCLFLPGFPESTGNTKDMDVETVKGPQVREVDGDVLGAVMNQQVEQNSSYTNIAECLSFTQHVQYVCTQKMAFVGDYRGNHDLLTDPQTITHLALGHTFAGGNNLDCYWEMETRHGCNKDCRHYGLHSEWDKIPTAPLLKDLEAKMNIEQPIV